ncbi:MAG TPA: GNAT family N-acetyltransferase [Myxococcales bacterium]|nr:GNAT family N-acetyltransferase [Myxococcales bacterium]
MLEETAGGPAAAGVTVSRYRESDRAALLEFRRDHYGADAAQADPAYVDWQFRDAPGAAESGAPLHVAWKDGRIVGTIGTVRTSVWVNGQPEPCSWVIDFAVHRDLRRSGIGDALAAVSRAEPRTRLVLEVTPAARGIAARAGHQVLGEVPLLVRPLQPARWLRSRGFPGPLAWISHAASPALAGLDALALRLARSERVELVETPSFDARADAIFAAQSRRYPVLCQRDRRWLEWRFERYPQPGRYRMYWVVRKGVAAGYAVLRAGTHHGIPSGVLADHLCDPAIVPAMLALCVERFRAAGAAVATCLQLDPIAGGAFRRLGFFRRNSGWRFLALPFPATKVSPLLDRGAWFLTAGDANVDRDRSASAERR